MATLKDLIKYTWLVATATLLLHLSTTEAFEYSAYCESQCKIGRGGNLCRCNAVHFAGKRTSLGTEEDEASATAGAYDTEVARMLSYLLGPKRSSGDRLRASQGEDYLETGGEADVGDNRGLVRGEKRYSPEGAMPYRSWYQDMKALMKGKLARGE